MSDDPHAVRARTHRHDNCGRCQRCNRLWPCPKAGKVDKPGRCRWAILAGALAALWCLSVGFVGWLAGWWL